jgi:hypothetical protein
MKSAAEKHRGAKDDPCKTDLIRLQEMQAAVEIRMPEMFELAGPACILG